MHDCDIRERMNDEEDRERQKNTVPCGSGGLASPSLSLFFWFFFLLSFCKDHRPRGIPMYSSTCYHVTRSGVCRKKISYGYSRFECYILNWASCRAVPIRTSKHQVLNVKPRSMRVIGRQNKKKQQILTHVRHRPTKNTLTNYIEAMPNEVAASKEKKEEKKNKTQNQF